MKQRFVTKIRRGASKNVTGIVVPAAIVEALGKGKRPPVKVTLNGYTYRSTVAAMAGEFMVGLSAEHRRGAKLEGDETLDVVLELDTAPRLIAPPADLEVALVRGKVLEAFERAAPSRRKEIVRQVEDAKAPETRRRRIAKAVEGFAKGSK